MPKSVKASFNASWFPAFKKADRLLNKSKSYDLPLTVHTPFKSADLTAVTNSNSAVSSPAAMSRGLTGTTTPAPFYTSTSFSNKSSSGATISTTK